MSELNWTLLQSFVHVVEAGSLSNAAQVTGGSQPTMSRHISMLEDAMGVRLFERSRSGATLTNAGTDLYAHAKTMADAATRISIQAEGKREQVGGTVRITASEIMATFVLPRVLTDLQGEEPDISIELVASDETNNLLRREADIAVRMYRPTQLDVITRHLGDMRLGAYASHSYLASKGMPESADDLYDHRFVGYDRSMLIIEGFRRAGMEVDRDFFCFRSDNQVVCWQMVVAGYGIGFNQCQIGDAEAGVRRLPVMDGIGTIPLWLTAHNELNKVARIRRVYDYLATALAKLSV